MEIPVFDRISGFEPGLNSLENQSLISRLFHLAGIKELYPSYSFWTWGALILALMATFSSLIHRFNCVIHRLWKDRFVISEPLLRPVINVYDEDDEDDDEEEESCSSSTSDGEDQQLTWSFENRRFSEEDFRVAGSRNYNESQGLISKPKLRRRGSFEDWFNFGDNKSVVKSWDGFGLWDLNKNEKMNSFFTGKCQIPAVSMMSQAVVLTAGLVSNKSVAMRVWDARISCQIPAIFAEWQPRLSNIVGINSGGVEKVYVRDDDNVLAVGDIRKARSPLVELTESEETTWWDADAVMVDDDDRDGCFDGSPVYCRGSVVSRCRNAVKSYLF